MGRMNGKKASSPADWDDCQGSHREKTYEERQIWEKRQLTRIDFRKLGIKGLGEKEPRILLVPLTCSSWCRSKTIWAGVRPGFK